MFACRAIESLLLFTTNTTTLHHRYRTTLAALIRQLLLRAVFTRAILHIILPCPRALSGALLGAVLATQLLPVTPLSKSPIQILGVNPTLGVRIEPSHTQPCPYPPALRFRCPASLGQYGIDSEHLRALDGGTLGLLSSVFHTSDRTMSEFANITTSALL